MADLHILTGEPPHWTLVMHFAIPTVNNAAGHPLRTCLVNSGLGGQTMLAEGVGPGQIATAERNQILAGEVFEHVATWPAESGGSTGPQIQAALAAFYQSEKNRILAALQDRLKHFGRTIG